MPLPPEGLNNCNWQNIAETPTTRYECAYCGHLVSSNKGFALSDRAFNTTHPGVTICPDCKCPTFHYPRAQTRIPGTVFGRAVAHLPKDIEQLYEEARTCTSSQCFTASVLLLRKLLMNIAVAQGAAEGLTFVKYVDHLADKGFVPPNGRQWVDHIRKKANEATHEIVKMHSKDAENLMVFMEMLLRFIYEFPNSLPKPKGA